VIDIILGGFRALWRLRCRFSLRRSDAALQQCPEYRPCTAFRQERMVRCTKIYPSCNLLFLCQFFVRKMSISGPSAACSGVPGTAAGRSV